MHGSVYPRSIFGNVSHGLTNWIHSIVILITAIKLRPIHPVQIMLGISPNIEESYGTAARTNSSTIMPQMSDRRCYDVVALAIDEVAIKGTHVTKSISSSPPNAYLETIVIRRIDQPIGNLKVDFEGNRSAYKATGSCYKQRFSLNLAYT